MILKSCPLKRRRSLRTALHAAIIVSMFGGEYTEEDMHFCPKCGFDFFAEREHKKAASDKKIEENPYRQLCYCLMTAGLDCGVREHPQEQMRKLGYKVLDAVPQSVYDSWWFTVEEFIEPLPPYLSKMQYNYDYWHNGCHKTCEYFKADHSCCYGGSFCKKPQESKK